MSLLRNDAVVVIEVFYFTVAETMYDYSTGCP